MRQITITMAEAFLRGEIKKVDNTMTDGSALYLFDNKIVEWRGDELWITNCGWQTKTTMERLNGIGALANFRICQKKKVWYLNGEEWDGEWIQIQTNLPRPIVNDEEALTAWIQTKVWKSIDGMRGYEEPTYAVCGANDTGMWDDSPCRSDVAEAELTEAKKVLKKSGIATKLMTCESSNVFCVHHYLIVVPRDKQRAEAIIKQYLEDNYTQLLYACK